MLFYTVLACTVSQMLTTQAFAFDTRSAWGTANGGSGTNFFALSASTHANSGTAAVYADSGRDSMLPGASITTIGVYNNLSVIGDDNVLTTDQTGTNTGSVTSDTDLTYETHEQAVTPPSQTLFPLN